VRKVLETSEVERVEAAKIEIEVSVEQFDSKLKPNELTTS
jgi:hypothetical protein